MSYQDRPRRDDRGGHYESTPRITPEQIDTIIGGISENAAEELVRTAEVIGKWLKEMEFSTSQIRNVFGVVREIEQGVEMQDSRELSASERESQKVEEGKLPPLPEGSYRKLVLLKPKLAYQYGRAGGEGKKNARDAMGLLQQVLSNAIDKVGRDRTRFTHFVEFFEAILAYHRCYGGKN